MLIGYRVTREEEIGLYPVDFIQVSIFRGMGGEIDRMLKTVSKCRSFNTRYVLHPVDYFISETRHKQREETMKEMRTIAKSADVALIIHDETTPWGTRLEDSFEEAYRSAFIELSEICSVSIENANNTPDAKWFWRRFADSVTLDIGHVEAAGLDSERFVMELESDIIDKLGFVHIHRYNGPHNGGLKDHWGLLEDCREIRALTRLLERKQNIGVILEINDKENLEKSLKLLERI